MVFGSHISETLNLLRNYVKNHCTCEYICCVLTTNTGCSWYDIVFKADRSVGFVVIEYFLIKRIWGLNSS